MPLAVGQTAARSLVVRCSDSAVGCSDVCCTVRLLAFARSSVSSRRAACVARAARSSDCRFFAAAIAADLARNRASLAGPTRATTASEAMCRALRIKPSLVALSAGESTDGPCGSEVLDALTDDDKGVAAGGAIAMNVPSCTNRRTSTAAARRARCCRVGRNGKPRALRCDSINTRQKSICMDCTRYTGHSGRWSVWSPRMHALRHFGVQHTNLRMWNTHKTTRGTNEQTHKLRLRRTGLD